MILDNSELILKCLSADSYVLQYNGDDSVVYMYPDKRSRTVNDHIAINFKTLEQDGLLLHSEGIQGDLFTLELKRGRLHLHISLGTTRVCWINKVDTGACCKVEIYGRDLVMGEESIGVCDNGIHLREKWDFLNPGIKPSCLEGEISILLVRLLTGAPQFSIYSQL